VFNLPTALIITRYFPPLSSAGASIRPVKLMKYAVEQGWSFAVLTQDPERTVIPEERLSEFLLDEIPVGTDIIRIGNPFFGQTAGARLGRKIARDSSLPWGAAVVRQAWKRFHHARPDIIFVNSPPFTNVAIGILLSGWFDVPLILDMKDDWVDSPAFWKKGKLRQAIETQIERKMVQRASAATIATRLSYDHWIKRYAPLGLAKKIFFVSNGEDLDEYRILEEKERKPENEKFLLLSAAAGYRPDYRDLSPFLQALELFLKRCPQAQSQMEIEFLGEKPHEQYKIWLGRLLPPEAVHYRSALKRQALVERLWQADLFFMVQPRNNFTAIAGTLYEYWATGKAPVLLFSETGASSNLVKDHQLGEHFHFDQVEEASRWIEHVFQAFCNCRPIWIERTGVEAYDRRKMVEQMLTIWDNAIKNYRRR
jgi:hypothetical protein